MTVEVSPILRLSPDRTLALYELRERHGQSSVFSKSMPSEERETRDVRGETVQNLLLVPSLSVDPRLHELEHLLLNLRATRSEVGVENSLKQTQ